MNKSVIALLLTSIISIPATYLFWLWDEHLNHQLDVLGWENYNGPDLDTPLYCYAGLVLLIAALGFMVFGFANKKLRIAYSKLAGKESALQSGLFVSSFILAMNAIVVWGASGKFSIEENAPITLPVAVFLAGLACLSLFRSKQPEPKKRIPKTSTREPKLSVTLNAIKDIKPLDLTVMAVHTVAVLGAYYFVATAVESASFRYFLIMLIPTIVYIAVTYTQFQAPSPSSYGAVCTLLVPFLLAIYCLGFGKTFPYYCFLLFTVQNVALGLLRTIDKFSESKLAKRRLLVSLPFTILLCVVISIGLEKEMFLAIALDTSAFSIIVFMVAVGVCYAPLHFVSQGHDGVRSLIVLGLFAVALGDVAVEVPWSVFDILVGVIALVLATVFYPQVTKPYGDFIESENLGLWGVSGWVFRLFTLKSYSDRS